MNRIVIATATVAGRTLTLSHIVRSSFTDDTMLDAAEMPTARVVPGVIFIARSIAAEVEHTTRPMTFITVEEMIDAAARAFVKTGSADMGFSAAVEVIP